MNAINLRVAQASKKMICKTLTLLLPLCLWALPAIAAESPQAVVQKGTDQVLTILEQYPQAPLANRKQIRAVVDGYFDFGAMSRLAVGPRWKSVSATKRQEFTNQFSKLLFNTYIGDIAKYAGQKITYSTQSLSPGSAVVEASIFYQGRPINLDYSLRPENGNWRVYDVAINGMSLAINYRAQFNSILANGSFNDLLRALQQKNAQICSSGRC